jgi:hypothetical protein
VHLTDLSHDEYVTADDVDTQMEQHLNKHRQMLPKNTNIYSPIKKTLQNEEGKCSRADGKILFVKFNLSRKSAEQQLNQFFINSAYTSISFPFLREDERLAAGPLASLVFLEPSSREERPLINSTQKSFQLFKGWTD